jgi:hypothetical protein
VFGFPHDKFGHVAGVRIGENLLADVLPAQGHSLGTKLFSKAESLPHTLAVRHWQPQVRWRFDIDDEPLGTQPDRHASCGPHQSRCQGARADTHQEALGGGPCVGDGMVTSVHLHLLVHPVGHAA